MHRFMIGEVKAIGTGKKTLAFKGFFGSKFVWQTGLNGQTIAISSPLPSHRGVNYLPRSRQRLISTLTNGGRRLEAYLVKNTMEHNQEKVQRGENQFLLMAFDL